MANDDHKDDGTQHALARASELIRRDTPDPASCRRSPVDVGDSHSEQPLRQPPPDPSLRPWLTYAEAAVYSRWSVAHLRNLVSAGQIPVYGKPRVRRFRRDMLDLFLTDPDAAMRRFRAERNRHGG